MGSTRLGLSIEYACTAASALAQCVVLSCCGAAYYAVWCMDVHLTMYKGVPQYVDKISPSLRKREMPKSARARTHTNTHTRVSTACLAAAPRPCWLVWFARLRASFPANSGCMLAACTLCTCCLEHGACVLGCHQEVVWLHVAVDDPVRVAVLQHGQHATHDVRGLRLGQGHGGVKQLAAVESHYVQTRASAQN